MQSFFYKILEWTRLLFGMRPRSGIGSARVFLVLHYCFITLVTILLAVFSTYIRNNWLPEVFRNRFFLGETLDRIWCGVAFLVVYIIIRIVLYLLELLDIKDESDFPDIENNWREILEALEADRLPIDDIPLFLVNGFTPQQEQSAFEAASQIDWRVIAPPLTSKSAVLRVYANDDAIFLCCAGVGATSYQHGKPAAESSRDSAAPRSSPQGVTGTMQAGTLQSVMEKAPAPTGTNPAGTLPAAAPRAAAPTGTQPGVMGGFFGTIAPGGMRRAMETLTALGKAETKGYGKKRLAPLTELESMVGVCRMQFLCRLITETRSPYCPINGMLQAVPFSWADAEDLDYPRRLASALRDDLIAVHETLELQFPVVAVVTELDDVAGMREFILRADRMRSGLRLSRAGSSFASGADVSEKNAEWVIRRGIQWFRGWVYSAFATDLDHRDNQKLFCMLCAINERREALVTLLRESMYKVVDPSLRLHGCYFCATGHASTEQGFIRGVLDKLPESQGEVAWTPRLLKSQQRSTVLGWCFWGAALILLAVSVLLFVTLPTLENA